jgi:pyrimidine-nucleoside phosphorylase
MHQPLGRSIGTGIEVVEARNFLRGERDPRADELVLAIASALVAEAVDGDPEARVERALENGSAYEKFAQMIAAQGGDVEAMERMQTGEPLTIAAPSSGYVREIDVVRLGHLGRSLSQKDALGGLRVAVRLGDLVEEGAPLIHAYGAARAEARGLQSAFTVGAEPPAALPLIYDAFCNAVTTSQYRQ